MTKKTLIWFAALLFLGKTYAAAEPSPAATENPRGKIVTLDFVNADLALVLKALSVQSGVDIITSPSVKEKLITLKITKVPTEKALELVTKLSQLDFRRVDDKYLVGTPAELDQIVPRPTQTETYTLKYLSPATAQPILTASIPTLKVQVRPDAPILIISGRAEEVQEARELLEAIDTPPPAAPTITETYVLKNIRPDEVRALLPTVAPKELTIKIEPERNLVIMQGKAADITTVKALLQSLDIPKPTPGKEAWTVEAYPLKFLEPKDIKTILGKFFPEAQLTVETQEEAISESKKAGTAKTSAKSASPYSILLAGPAEIIASAKKIIQVLDVPPMQVLIEAVVADVGATGERELGTLWSPAGSAAITTFTFSEKAAGAIATEPPALMSVVRPTYRSRAETTISATLMALEKAGKAKVLATPKIAAVDGEEANILLGDRIPYIIYQPGAGGVLVPMPQVEEIGIRLKVIPRINDKEFITVRVEPQVSSFVEFTPAGYPRVKTRQAAATIRVKDGETILIGGLLKEEETKNLSKVPLIGDLPFFGELFKWRYTRKEKSELMIFITPRIIPAEGLGIKPPKIE